MTHTSDILDISKLPEHLKKELLDYYEYLTDKYQKKDMQEQVNPRAKCFRKFISDPARITHYQPCSRDLLHERR
jgi:hypothetical protein